MVSRTRDSQTTAIGTRCKVRVVVSASGVGHFEYSTATTAELQSTVQFSPFIREPTFVSRVYWKIDY